MEQEYAELFNDDVKNALQDALKDMKNNVDVYVFIDSKDENCQYCDLTVKFMNLWQTPALRTNKVSQN